MHGKKVAVSVLLTEEMAEKVGRLAKESHRSRSAYMRQVLRKYIQCMETKDDPEAEPVNWEMDQWVYFRSLDAPGGQ